MNRRARILSLLAVLVLVLFAFVPAASAFDGRTGDQVVVGKDEVVNDDLFVGATTVVVDGTINGDLIAAGETVTINGSVTGNVFAAGSSVTVNGKVGHDLVAAGVAVTLGPDARIGYNAYTLGASVDSQPGSQIGGSLVLGGGQGLISGQTTNDLVAGASRLRLEGTVGRNAKISVESSAARYSPAYYGSSTPAIPAIPGGLTFGPAAHVVGSLEYVSPETVAVPSSVAAEVTHTLPPQDQQLSRELAQRQSASNYVFDAARRLVGLLLVGLLIAWLAPRWITGPADKLLSKPLPSVGVGLVGVVAAPVGWLVALAVVVMVAVIFGLLSLGGLTALTLLAGLPVLGIAFVALLIVAMYLCQAIVAYLGGLLILGLVRPERSEGIYLPLLIGLVVLGVLFAIPLVGGWLEFLVVLGGVGAIALVFLQGRPAPQAPAEAPAVGQA